GPVALSGAVLVAPLAFVRLEEPAALPVLALFLAGTTLLFLSGARLVLGGRRIAFRPLTASLSVLIFVAPPDVLPLKLGVLPALLGSFAAVSLRYLTRAEDRFPRRVWWLRAAAVLCGVAMMLPLGVAISANGSVQGAVELLGPLAAICAVLFMAGLLLGYTTLAFAASDLIGTVT